MHCVHQKRATDELVKQNTPAAWLDQQHVHTLEESFAVTAA
jgi:hypothetical protein